VPCSYIEGKINVKGVSIMQSDPVWGMQIDEKLDNDAGSGF
jgi:hypothetical protein